VFFAMARASAGVISAEDFESAEATLGTEFGTGFAALAVAFVNREIPASDARIAI
jgi:hypothetical protein